MVLYLYFSLAYRVFGVYPWPQAFFKITIPMLSPILFFNLVMGVIGGLQTFTQVYIMTAGGPNNASMMMVPYLFHHAFEAYRMGYASAIAWVLFLIIKGMTLIVFKSSSMLLTVPMLIVFFIGQRYIFEINFSSGSSSIK